MSAANFGDPIIDACYFCVFYSVKPTLKKVSKYENKFAKLQKKAAEFNFRNQLKVVKKKEFTLEEEEKEVRLLWRSTVRVSTDTNPIHIFPTEQKKPDWSKGKPGDAKAAEAEGAAA